MVKVWLNGNSGRMGQEITIALGETKDLSLIGGSSNESSDADFSSMKNAEMIIDFSSVEGNRRLYRILKESSQQNLCLLIGTTGLDDNDRKNWQSLCEEKKHAAMLVSNTSLGIMLSVKVARTIAPLLHKQGFDIEIEETHHRHKVDSPSGTALTLAEALAKATGGKLRVNRSGKREIGEIGITSTRGGGVFGEHSVRFISDAEEITISHRAFSRALFAKGAMHLAQWLHANRRFGEIHPSDEVFAETF